MSNVAVLFRKLLPSRPLLVGTVLSSSSGTLIVELPGGGRVSARGDGTVGTKVFVRDGVVEGPAPNLTVVLIDV